MNVCGLDDEILYYILSQMVNNEGVWVKLDDESKKRYCHEVEGEAWSLARGVDDIFYIQHEANLSAEAEDTVKAFNAVSNVPAKGFDFTTAQQTPSFSAFGSPGSGKCARKGKEIKQQICYNANGRG